MVICDSSPGVAREARGAPVRPPAAGFAEADLPGSLDLPSATHRGLGSPVQRRPRSPILHCAEFVFETHNARMMLARFVTRRSWYKGQEKYKD